MPPLISIQTLMFQRQCEPKSYITLGWPVVWKVPNRRLLANDWLNDSYSVKGTCTVLRLSFLLKLQKSGRYFKFFILISVPKTFRKRAKVLRGTSPCFDWGYRYLVKVEKDVSCASLFHCLIEGNHFTAEKIVFSSSSPGYFSLQKRVSR